MKTELSIFTTAIPWPPPPPKKKRHPSAGANRWGVDILILVVKNNLEHQSRQKERNTQEYHQQYTYLYMSVCIYIYTHVYVCVYIYIYMYVCISVYMRVRVRVCVCGPPLWQTFSESFIHTFVFFFLIIMHTHDDWLGIFWRISDHNLSIKPCQFSIFSFL